MIIQSRIQIFFKTVFPVILFGLVLTAFVLIVTNISDRSESEGLQLTYDSVRRAAVQCYALEGVYPADFEYLKEHYGIRPDEEKYVIYYEYIASNLMPDITVVPASATLFSLE
ncbi:MAG: hypothetical protein LBL49_00950 [Clostridiales Family XIII bacterium]|jgi:hypothetical protein|nr:hypothetical protein [Clostridiales Family XIII bacterium]